MKCTKLIKNIIWTLPDLYIGTVYPISKRLQHTGYFISKAKYGIISQSFFNQQISIFDILSSNLIFWRFKIFVNWRHDSYICQNYIFIKEHAQVLKFLLKPNDTFSPFVVNFLTHTVYFYNHYFLKMVWGNISLRNHPVY